MVAYGGIIPEEHDAKQFKLNQEAGKAEQRLADLCNRAHSMAGDQRRGYGYRSPWIMKDGDAVDRVRRMARNGDDRAAGLIKDLAHWMAEADRLHREYLAMEATWREYKWTRWFPCLNSDGHIHSSLRGCKTVNMSTSMGWETGLSGRPVEAVIEALGPRLCSVCFPEAPVEHCQSLRDITREQREAEKAARAEAKFIKGLRREEQFYDCRGDRVETVAACKQALREEFEFQYYYGRGPHPYHPEAVTAAKKAAEVLLAREAAKPGTGATQAEIGTIRERAEKKARKEAGLK